MEETHISKSIYRKKDDSVTPMDNENIPAEVIPAVRGLALLEKDPFPAAPKVPIHRDESLTGEAPVAIS